MTLNWAVTVAPPAAPWTTLDRDNDETTFFGVADLNETSDAIDTGLVFQRGVQGCTNHIVGLSDSSNQIFDLFTAKGDTLDETFTGQQALYNPYVNEGNVRVFFKQTGYTYTEKVLTVELITDMSGGGSCSNVTLPAELSLNWLVTVTAGSVGWKDQGSHSDVAGAVSPVIVREASGRTDTGLAFHQSPSGCRRVDVSLAANAPDSVELVRYDGDIASSVTSLSDIHMEKDHASDNHVRLMIKAGATLTAGAVAGHHGERRV